MRLNCCVRWSIYISLILFTGESSWIFFLVHSSVVLMACFSDFGIGQRSQA